MFFDNLTVWAVGIDPDAPWFVQLAAIASQVLITVIALVIGLIGIALGFALTWNGITTGSGKIDTPLFGKLENVPVGIVIVLVGGTIAVFAIRNFKIVIRSRDGSRDQRV